MNILTFQTIPDFSGLGIGEEMVHPTTLVIVVAEGNMRSSRNTRETGSAGVWLS